MSRGAGAAESRPGAPGGRTRRGRRDRLYQGDLAPGGKTLGDQDAWLCFAEESGQISLAGLVCRKAGRRARLIFRMLVHHGRKGEKNGFREKDFASLLDVAHQQLGGNIVLVWDDYSHHVDAAMRELIEKRPWLAVYRFPAYTPDLNPAQGVWAHLKKSLGNLAPCSIDDLARLVRTRLKRMQYRPDLLDGFIAVTGLIRVPP
ncbi:transposase [Streptomyces sp. GESEQ-35]|uniref:transposase n=1 Tax=Streptomyces sp. GESEQ-35 TaxID=2812657 RepID=UPI0027E31CCA|nr:transposase [Streptomyces sp. GESEQ-35]